MLENSVHEHYGWGPEAFAGSHGDGGCLPASPQVPSYSSQLRWWNMTVSAELTTLAASRQTQPKVQHIAATFMDNTSRVIWTTIKNLTTLDVNSFYSL